MEPLFARYPFLEGARAAVDAAEIDLADLVRTGDAPEIARAVERVEGAIHDGRVPDPIADTRVELLSYPIARVLVSLVDEPALTDRYALAEARRAADLIAADSSESRDLRTRSTQRMSIDDLLDELGITARPRPNVPGYELRLSAYLSLSADLRDPQWRLVNRRVADGQVLVTPPELETLLREAIRERVAEGLPLQVPTSIAEPLGTHVSEIERSLLDISIPPEPHVVIPELFPDCMQRLLGRVDDGGDLSAFERFTILAFLTGIGLDEEEILTLLPSDSNLNADGLRTQVRLVHGGSRSTAYPPPSCGTLERAGICDGTCEGGHPLIAYERRLSARRESRMSGTEPSEPA